MTGKVSGVRRGAVRAGLLGTTLLAAFAAVAARAQTAAPAPVEQTADGNGVDLFSGHMTFGGPVLSAGGGDGTGLAYFKLDAGGGVTDNINGALYQDGSTVFVTIGAATDKFAVSGGGYAPLLGNGSSLSLSGSTFTYVRRDGLVAHFNKVRTQGYPYYANNGTLSDMRAPGGLSHTYTYGQMRYCSSLKPGRNGSICMLYSIAYRVAAIEASNGYRLSFGYNETELGDETDPDWRPDLIAYTNVASATITNTATGAVVGSHSYATDTGGVHITDAGGGVTTYGYSAITLPGSTAPVVTFSRAGDRVASVTAAGVTTGYSASDGNGERVVASTAGGQTTTHVFDLATGRLSRTTDPLGHTTSFARDGFGRVTRVTRPEGDAVDYGYDARGNVVATTAVGKPSAGGGSRVVGTASFDPNCGNALVAAPCWTRDEGGNQTDYAYDAGTGNVTSVTAPAGAGGVRPQTRFGYTSVGGVSLPAETSQCRTGASCAGTADETVLSVQYNANLLPVSVTTRAGDGSVVATVGMSYDGRGNLVAVDGPLPGAGDVTSFRWDGNRRQVQVAGPAGASGRRPVTVTGYRPDGLVATVGSGHADGNGDGAVVAQVVEYGYDGNRRRVTETLTAGGTTVARTGYGYDGLGRLVCTAVRMDPGQWYGQTDYCTPQTGGPNGPDRVTQYGYDGAGRRTQQQSAVGTAAATLEQTGYTANGQVGSVTDGEGNTTSYGYDAYDRAVRTTYPGGSYEELGFDAAGNVASRRLRDGQVVSYGHDALGRTTAVTRPGGVYWQVNHGYGYDLQGLLVQASDSNGRVLSFGYDALGRRVSQGDNWYGPGSASYQYDAAGRRTRATWWDGFFVTYEYDAAGRMTAVRENGGLALASYGYDDLGRRVSLSRGNGTVTSWSYDAASRLQALGQDLAGGAWDQGVTFGYNPAGQIASRTSSNDAYAYGDHYNLDRPYAVNGLNQYTSAGGTGFGYDGRGNLTQSGGTSYGYTVDNQLATAPGANNAYDPLGRLFNVNGSGANTTLLYDGADLIAEVDGNTGGLTKRYVHGPGTDEPLVQYDAGGRRYLHADERGSVIALSDDAGNAVAINRYDEHGIPQAGNQGRFQYIGQKWIAELGLYDYKARMYSPTLGRFMQTDPIGYSDGLNWYDYVGSDPVNGTDPSGMYNQYCTGSIIAIKQGESCSSASKLLIDGVDSEATRMARANAVSDALGGSVSSSFANQVAACWASSSCRNGSTASPQIAQGDIVVTGQLSRPSTWLRGAGRLRTLPVELLVELLTPSEACCFTAGTLVSTPTGLKAIETLKVGDLVMSRSDKTGETAAKPVLGITPAHERRIWTVTVSYKGDDGRWTDERYETTDDHPWRTVDNEWVTSASLKHGQVLARENGTAIVATVVNTKSTKLTYNLEVADFHTYFVGEAETWVHNECDYPLLNARKLGYSLDKNVGRQHGQLVFRNGTQYISRDVDRHNGGYWKKFEMRGGVLFRTGTWDKYLNTRLGK